MGAWASINISSCGTNGCQHAVLHITEKSRYSNRTVNDSNKAVMTFLIFILPLGTKYLPTPLYPKSYVHALFCILLCFSIIKTCGSVLCGPRSRQATPVSILTGRKKMHFSHLRSSVLPW